MKSYAERLYLENLHNVLIEVNMDLSKKQRIDLIDLIISVKGGDATYEELESMEKRLTLAQRWLTKGQRKNYPNPKRRETSCLIEVADEGQK